MYVMVSRRDLEWEGSFIIAASPALLVKEGLGMLPKSPQCTLAGMRPDAWVCVCFTYK